MDLRIEETSCRLISIEREGFSGEAWKFEYWGARCLLIRIDSVQTIKLIEVIYPFLDHGMQ